MITKCKALCTHQLDSKNGRNKTTRDDDEDDKYLVPIFNAFPWPWLHEATTQNSVCLLATTPTTHITGAERAGKCLEIFLSVQSVYGFFGFIIIL
jgi:hypothetical protein